MVKCKVPRDRLSQTVLVTGSLGAIGDATVQLLAYSGAQVVGFDSRSLTTKEDCRFSKFIIGDVCDEHSIAAAIDPVDVVIHLAAWVHANPSSETEERKLYAINYEATKNIAAICVGRKKNLVFTSSVAVYGDSAKGNLDEGSPVLPESAYAHSKLLAEHHVLEAGGIVLRLPMVYGANDRGNMARMIRAIRNGRFVVPGRGDSLHTFAGRWNVARAVLCAISKEAARGRMFLVTDDEDVKLGELCDLISDFCKCPRPLRVPWPLVAGVALLGSGLKKVTRRKVPIEWSSYAKLTRSLTFDGRKIRQELGYRPAKTLRDGLKEEVDWLFSQSSNRT